MYKVLIPANFYGFNDNFEYKTKTSNTHISIGTDVNYSIKNLH
jgi:hypothetical protein